MAARLSSLMVLLGLQLYLQRAQCYGTDDVMRMRAALGRDADLPCGPEKVFLDGPGSYVAWMRYDKFIYRFPSDESESGDDSIIRTYYGDDDGCDGRGHGCVDQTSLHIKGVTEQDSGVYSCRVHYQTMPSMDYSINVEVVEPPRKPRLFAEGMETNNGYVGPLAIGTDLKLVCELEHADNNTILYWRRNGQVLSGASRLRPRSPLAIEHRVGNLTRADLDAHYECAAQNSDVSEPVAAHLSVKMYLPPISVELRLNDNVEFPAGEPRVVDCVVVGCVPPPTVTWHLGDHLLKPSTHKEHHEGNFTVSTLSVSPSLSDHGAELACRAHNPYLRDQLYQQAVTINVGYKPVCLRMREETVGVVEGVKETVTCSVEAAPEPLQFTWNFVSSRKAYSGAKPMPGHRHRYTSSLSFLATPEDLGTLECRATNSFGTQDRACTYRLVRGGAPDTPACLLLRSYPGSARIECKKGFDGGRPQMIHLRILTNEGAIVSNHSNSLGHFHLQEAKDQRNLTAVIYASSIRGQSSTVTMNLQNLAPSTIEGSAGLMSPSGYQLMVVALETVGVLALVLCTLVAVITWRARRRKGTKQEHQGPDVTLLQRTDGSFHREPDFIREENLANTTVTHLNQLKTCESPAKREELGGSINYNSPHNAAYLPEVKLLNHPVSFAPVAIETAITDHMGRFPQKTFYV